MKSPVAVTTGPDFKTLLRGTLMETFNSKPKSSTSTYGASVPSRCKTPEDCPKFLTCSAPICPLDSNFRKRVHLERERICIYLREAAKPISRLPETPSLPWQLIIANHRPICDTFGPIRRGLAVSAKTRSRLQQCPCKPQPQREKLLSDNSTVNT